MAIEPGEKGRASDFIYAADISADQADDEGKVAKLGPNGRIENQFIDYAFGDGSDSDVVLDGSTDFNTFSSRSGSDYTLTRDVYFDNLTINGGVNLITAGWRIFVKNTIDGSGKISWNGANGTNGGGAFTTNSGSGSANNQGSGGSAVTGYFSNQAGTNGGSGRRQDHGESGIAGINVRSALGFAGGQGGNGVASTGDTGGVGTQNGGSGGTVGTVTAPATKIGIIKAFTLLAIDFDPNNTETVNSDSKSFTSGSDTHNFQSHFHSTVVPNTLRKFNGGSGGTGGGAGGGSNSGSGDGWGAGGGGGGASGGVIFICARNWAGSFEIEARGGNGGTGGDFTASVNGAGGGGGGGGGAGGVAIIVYQFKTWSGAFDFAGGTGGAGGAGGTDSNGDVYAAGGTGANGTTGDDYQFFIGALM